MKDKKLTNIQKESEKLKIKKSINEYEDLKAQALLKLGIMTFDKIRKNKIYDEDFNDLCEEIKNYDIEIYTKYMSLRNFEKESNKTTCECGYVAFKNEKFCPQCGNSLIKEEKLSIICPNCNQETDEDSNFCACCGSKIEKITFNYEDKQFNEEVNCEEENFDFSTESEEAPEVDMIEEIEKEGREFLKNYEDTSIK